jgi:hypothetical protein
MELFKGEKILSTPSFGVEVKPSVQCRRFAACKRSLELRGNRILDEICRNISRPRRVPPFAARGVSRRWTWRHLAEEVGTSKGGGNQWQLIPQELAQDAVCQSHTGRLTGYWFLLKRPKGWILMNEWIMERFTGPYSVVTEGIWINGYWFRNVACVHVSWLCQFLRWGVVSPSSSPKLKDHPLSAVRDYLFNISVATLRTVGRFSIRNPRTRHVLVTGTDGGHW